MYLEYDKIFTSECLYELNRRMLGKSPYGPAKVYGIAQCEKTSITLGQIPYDLPWDIVSIVIVSMDCIIAFFITIMIIKLRSKENDSVSDMKQQKVRLEDFCVNIPEIPIGKEDYNNSPDLLTAMLAVHLEEIVGHELQCIPEMAGMQKYENQVLAVNYGYTNQTTLKYIIDMWAECEKIADLKKKLQVDPENTRLFEAQIW
jgi:hypothetical protein